MPPAPPGSSPDPSTPETENTSGMTGFRPVSPPPTPWRAATTSSVLAAILPPMGGPTPSTPSERERPDVKPKASAPPASSWSQIHLRGRHPGPTPENDATRGVVGRRPGFDRARCPVRPSSAALRWRAEPPTARAAAPRASDRPRRGRNCGRGRNRFVRSPPAGGPPRGRGRASVRDPARRTHGVPDPGSVDGTERRGDEPRGRPDDHARYAIDQPRDEPGALLVRGGGGSRHPRREDGESLTSIAAQYGVTPQAIERANKLKDANLLRIGQKLIIPTAH